MEHVIAKLLQEFEQGRMTRRQLIQSLAATAASSALASVPTVAAAAQGQGKVFRATAFNQDVEVLVAAK